MLRTRQRVCVCLCVCLHSIPLCVCVPPFLRMLVPEQLVPSGARERVCMKEHTHKHTKNRPKYLRAFEQTTNDI